MRERIFSDLARGRIQAAQNVLLERVVPHHVIAIDPDGVGARRRSWQVKFLDVPALGIEVADLAPYTLGEPDGAVGIHLETLRFAFRRGIPLGYFSSLGDPDDRAIVSVGREPLIAVLPNDVAISSRGVEMRELLGRWVKA